MTLFSAFEVMDSRLDRYGYRLHRLEWFNWGTFDSEVHHLDLDGHNTLLTGDIGSGKSTIVDAVSTLLLRSDRISYNKAAGADLKERTLRSYVQGHYKMERNEATGTSRPVALRGDTSYSVLLAVFRNEALNEDVTLAHVAYLTGSREGQPPRFYVVADRRLSITQEFADFGPKMADLPKRLKGQGVLVFDTFTDYEKSYRRALGIPSRQAMDLFHQTISMKSVGSLNDFVRDHMLEPFDAASRIRGLIGHFEDLQAAHDAVVRARLQLEKLAPLLESCDAHEKATRAVRALQAEQHAVQNVGWGLKQHLLKAELATTQASLAARTTELEATQATLERLRQRETGLRATRAGFAGGRLEQIESELTTTRATRVAREQALHRLNERLAGAGLPAVTTVADVAGRLEQAQSRLQQLTSERATVGERQGALEADKRELEARARFINEELKSLQQRRSNIPTELIRLREKLCDQLSLLPEDVPFVGELLQVRDDDRAWQGAAERVLRGFGMSLAVREQHYSAIASWINDHHLGTRLVFLRVPARPRPPRETEPLGPGLMALADRVEVADGDLRPWLEAELSHRADHACVESMGQFRRLVKAVTIQGLVKSRDRHEKDDRSRVDDPTRYVLGWSNTLKVDTLLDQASAVKRESDANAAARADLMRRSQLADQQHGHLLVAVETSTEDVDWWSAVRLITDLETEHRDLVSSSGELQRIDADLATVAQEIQQAEAIRSATDRAIGTLTAQVETAEHEVDRLTRLLSGTPEPSEDARTAVLRRLGKVAASVEVEPAVVAAISAVASTAEARAQDAARAANRAIRLMGDFRHDYPVETSEFDDSMESTGEYRELHRRLAQDDLPRFEADFKRALTSETINEIASFAAQLRKQEGVIRDRVAVINDALHSINYNTTPDTYITLEHRPTPNVEVREFRRDLQECIDGSLNAGDDQYSETKFLQVQRLIARFKGREGVADSDRAWTTRVTDVRNWLEFSGSERFRGDDAERETFSDSDGKSGGQKEKLAYTILAAALTYQFKIDPGVPHSRAFRFAIIDEAFGRGSEASTRYALELFSTFGLQLLVVTPLQKVHVIEPYVSRVGFVANPDGNRSALLSMTISEYRERASKARNRAVDQSQPAEQSQSAAIGLTDHA